MAEKPTQTITVETLPVITHQDARVITTDLLATLYGTKPTNLTSNFSNNENRFVAGKHFFKLEGDPLREFKNLHRVNLVDSVEISPRVKALMLWTERGAARHAKMLDTDQAWEVFEKLEDAYFGATGEKATTETLIPSEIQTLHEVIDHKASAAGPALKPKAYGEIYARLQNKFRVHSYKALPRTQLADALVYVTRLDLHCAPTPAPQAPELLNANDMANLSRLIWLIAHWFEMDRAWINGIWAALRQATGVPSPNRFRVGDLPVIAAELRRIWIAAEALHDACLDAQRLALRRVVRDGAAVETLLAEQRARLLTAATEERAAFASILASWNERNLDQLVGRAPNARGIEDGTQEAPSGEWRN